MTFPVCRRPQVVVLAAGLAAPGGGEAIRIRPAP